MVEVRAQCGDVGAEIVADMITAELKKLDTADAIYFTSWRRAFELTGLAQ